MKSVFSIDPKIFCAQTQLYNDNLPITTNTCNVYVANNFTDDVIGYIIVNLNRGNYWIEHFYVKEDWRDLGIGQALLVLCIENYKTIHLIVSKTNVKAISIYKKYNFETIYSQKNYLKMKRIIF